MSESWLWLTSGLLLMLAEFIVPGFIVFFFGLGAVAMAAVSLFFDLPLGWEILLFTVLSVVLLATCRRFLPATFRGKATRESGDPDDDGVAGSRATVLEAIAPDRPGKVEFRGTPWTARSDAAIPAGATVEILSRDNLLLAVRPLPQSQP